MNTSKTLAALLIVACASTVALAKGPGGGQGGGQGAGQGVPLGTATGTFTRKLSGGEGDLALAEGQVIPFGIAIHADKTIHRFHHVSLGYTLGLGANADVKASK